MRSLLVGLMLVSLTLVGCSRESPKGGPGKGPVVTTDGTTPGKTNVENRDETFSVKVPAGGTNVTQGKREEVSISIDRGSNFKQAVKLTFTAPTGLKVVPAETTIKSGDSKTNVFVEAADTATVDRHSITVTGTPDTGKATSVTMDIDVKKK